MMSILTSLCLIVRVAAFPLAPALMFGLNGQPEPAAEEPAPAQTAPAQAVPPNPPDPKPIAPPAGVISNTDDLLRALETSGDDLRALSAQLRYTRDFAIAGDRQIRVGRLLFVSGPQRTGRKFSIEFTKLFVGQRVSDEVKVFIFDGSWLVEKWPGEKRFVKRRVVRPGEEFDPLKIGEGPFPIPIGQRRADILREYDAELLPPADGLEDPALVKFVGDAWQLKLTPRAELADDAEFVEVRLWYTRDGLLPRMARTEAPDGDVSTVQLVNVKLNGEAEVGEADFDVRTPAPGSGWDVDVREWREPE